MLSSFHLFMMGIERIQPAPGRQRGIWQWHLHADYSHFTRRPLLLSAVFCIVCSLRWARRSGLVLALVSFSHWLLDLIVHRGNLPILPGDLRHFPRLGFGLWQIKPAAAGRARYSATDAH
jgi:hypothetical protein